MTKFISLSLSSRPNFPPVPVSHFAGMVPASIWNICFQYFDITFCFQHIISCTSTSNVWPDLAERTNEEVPVTSWRNVSHLNKGGQLTSAENSASGPEAGYVGSIYSLLAT